MVLRQFWWLLTEIRHNHFCLQFTPLTVFSAYLNFLYKNIIELIFVTLIY